MSETLKKKYSLLINFIKSLDSIIISYSGGVDSSLLAYIVSNEAHHKKYLCVLVDTNFISSKNLNKSIQFLKYYNLKYTIIKYDFTLIHNIQRNTENRCFFCKKKMISLIFEFSKKNKYEVIIEGTNISDIKDNTKKRPGINVISNFHDKYMKIYSPFLNFNFTKEEILFLSKLFKLKNQYSDSCLATRIQYKIPLTKKRLNIVEKSELILLSLGFKNVRVRFHIDSLKLQIARIEINQDQLFLYFKYAKLIQKKFKKIVEFQFITLDINGFKSGSFDQYIKK